MTVALAILAPLILAAGFRLRGDAVFARWTGRGATTARIVAWAIPCGLIAWGLYGEWYVGLAMAVAAFLGAILGWWQSLDLGRVEGTWLKDFAMHTLRGVLWTAPMGAAAWLGAGNPVPLLIAGALCGVAYEIGWRFKARQTEIAEAVFGAVVGLGMVASAPW